MAQPRERACVKAGQITREGRRAPKSGRAVNLLACVTRPHLVTRLERIPPSHKAIPEAGLGILKGEVRGAIWGSGSCGKAVVGPAHPVYAVTSHPYGSGPMFLHRRVPGFHSVRIAGG